MFVSPPIYAKTEIPDKFTHVNVIRLTRLASRDLASYIRQIPMYYNDEFLMDILRALNEEEGIFRESISTII